MNPSTNSDAPGRPPLKRRPRALPEIGTFYALTSPLWRYQVLGDRKPHVWEVTHHIDGRAAFDNRTGHTVSGYWIKKYVTRCQRDGSPLDPDYVQQQTTELQRQERQAAVRPDITELVGQLIRDHHQPPPPPTKEPA